MDIYSNPPQVYRNNKQAAPEFTGKQKRFISNMDLLILMWGFFFRTNFA
jgi:hypothetical protein